MTRSIDGPGGRAIQVHETGGADGPLVIFHHGTPCDGLIPAGWIEHAATAGIRLVSYDRPGYGGSDRRPGRAVADAADDVAAILDALGVERFATWGASGGGPHALACAALLAERCAVAVTVAGVAPFAAPDLDWSAGMGQDNVAEFAAAVAGADALAAFLTPELPALQQIRAEDLVGAIRPLLSDVDARALSDALGEHFAAQFREGLGPGAEGWIDDDLAFARDWGFALDAVAAPVQVWQGPHDLMVPEVHGRWLGTHVPGADLRLAPQDGHVSLLETRMPAILDAIARYTF